MILVALVLILLAGALFFLWTNIDALVKAAIEKYGSQVTKTAVRVSSVKIKLTAGEGTIGGLTVANPSGFSSPYAFSLGKINAKIETGTVTSDLIVIDRIVISAPQVMYEINASGSSNINTLKKNIEQPEKGKPKEAPQEKKTGGKEKKLLIRKLIIEKGEIDLRIAAVGEKTEKLKLPPIELTDIGKGSGATPAQVAEEVLSALVDKVGVSVAKSSAAQYLNKGVEGAMKKLFGK
jgi:hypothetical protein